MKVFLNEIFFNLLLKMHIVFPIDHMFCVNHFRINMDFSKCVDFVTKYVALKIYHNLKSYQNMLATLGFFFLAS
jgi:hypothetical protein